MAKLTLTQMQSELSRRLSGMIPTTDTTTLNSALDRATRFLDSLCSYTFLQGKVSGHIDTSTSIPIPANMNLQKETKLYINGIRLNHVPYSELQTYSSFLTLTPTAFSYTSTANIYQKLTATAAGNTDGTDITYTAPNPIVFTNIQAFVTTGFPAGSTMNIGVTIDATAFDAAIPITVVGFPLLTLSPLPIVYPLTVRPRVAVTSTGAGSVDVYFYYTMVGASPAFILNASVHGNYDLYYTQRMTMPSTGAEMEIPEQWYDIIIDIAEMQQKELYHIVMADQVRAANTERVKMFVREFNSTQEANININDEMIRKGA